jgi:hypothetical protein
MIAGESDSPLIQSVDTDSGAYLTSYSMGTRRFSPEVKRPKLKANQLLPSSVEVKNEYSYTSTPPYALMACRVTTVPYCNRHKYLLLLL